MTESEAQIKGHEPVPEQRPPRARATCPCGYGEMVDPVWSPYLGASGWKLAWYYGVKCPQHGWASRLRVIRKRPAFNFVESPEEDFLYDGD